MEYKIGDVVLCLKSDKLLRIKSLGDGTVLCDDGKIYKIDKIEYILCNKYANIIENKYKHRAEVAELVVHYLNTIFQFDYQTVFELAEKQIEKDALLQAALEVEEELC